MKCTFCNKKVVLIPSAEERAKKDLNGNSASYYTKLFPYHSDCFLKHRDSK